MEGDFSMSFDFTDVTGSTSSGISGTGTVFTEYSATVSGTDDDMAAVYIDWGDGQTPDGTFTNDKRYANYQWVQLTDPKGTVNVKHTYTSTGTFKPIIQVINNAGFASAYYGAASTGSLAADYPLPYKQETTVSGCVIEDGQATGILKADKRVVKSGIDNTLFETEGPNGLWAFIAPTCTEAELQYIDDPEDKGIECHINCTLRVSSYGTGTTWGDLGSSDVVRTLAYQISGSDFTSNRGFDDILARLTGQPILKRCQVVRVNWVKLIKCGGTKDGYGTQGPLNTRDIAISDAWNKFRLFICSRSSTWENLGVRTASSGIQQAFTPICYVSAGDPVKYSDDPDRNVTFDFSQSRAKASNGSLTNYKFDDGCSYYKIWNCWQLNDGDKFLGTGNYFTDETMTTGSTYKAQYTYRTDPLGLNNGGDAQSIVSGGAMNITGSAYANHSSGTKWTADNATKYQVDQFFLNDFFSFADQYYLARMSTQPASAANLSGANVSSLSGNRMQIYRIAGGAVGKDSGDINHEIASTKLNYSDWRDVGSGTPVTTDLLSSYPTIDYTKAGYTNIPGDSLQYHGDGTGGLGQYPIANSSVSLYNLNDTNFGTFDSTSYSGDDRQEKLLMLLPNQTNTLFFDIANFAPQLGQKTSQTGTHTDYGSSNGPQAPWKFEMQYLSGRRIGTIHQELEWKPLEIRDTTTVSREFTMTMLNPTQVNTSGNRYFMNSSMLSKSGPVSFDIPADWVKMSLSGASAGTFNRVENTLATGTSDVVQMNVSGAFKDSTAVSGYGLTFAFSGSGISDVLKANNFTETSDIGSYKYAFFPKIDSTTTDTMNAMYWLASGAADGWDGDDTIYCQYGDATECPPLSATTANCITGSIRRINMYEMISGYTKVYNQGTSNATADIELVPVDGSVRPYPNLYNVTQTNTNAGVGQSMETAWQNTEYYPLRMVISGGAVNNDDGFFPAIKNIFDANQSNCVVIKEIDNSAYGMSTHPITTDISFSMAGTYYQAVSRKGKVHLQRTGTPIQSIGFESVDLGEYNLSGSGSSFGKAGGKGLKDRGTLHWYYRMARRLQENSRRVYYDLQQKDSTYIRFWGVINNLQATYGADGDKAVNRYSFNMIVDEVALLDNVKRLMTDPYPLGAEGTLRGHSGQFG